MANPFFQASGMSSPPQKQVSFNEVYQQFCQKAGGNPMNLFMQLASKNPQLQPALQLLKGGMSPEQVFNTLCQNKGVNPQDILKQFMG